MTEKTKIAKNSKAYRERLSCGGLFKKMDVWAHHDDKDQVKELVEDLRQYRLRQDKK